MLPTKTALAILWWASFTILGIWAHKVVPGVDFLAPGLILSLQEEGRRRSALLALIWILLIEGSGNLPFGYGLAWYGLLSCMYFGGRWLFEARSFLFIALIGAGAGLLHPVLVMALTSLAGMHVPLERVATEGAIQAASFPIIWLLADTFFPKKLRQDVRPL